MNDVHGALALAEALKKTMARADESTEPSEVGVTPDGGASFSITTPLGEYVVSVRPI